MITEGLLKECHQEFEDYFKSLKSDSQDIKARIKDIHSHTLQVVSNSQLLSKMLVQNEDDKDISEIIALFHDLGRVTLMAQGTESPTNIHRDHSAYSVKLIQQMNFYPKLPVDVQLIVLKAIDNHNSPKLAKLDNEQQMLFARILRDADKLDILDSSYRFFKEKSGIQPLVTFDLVSQAEVSDKIIKSIMAGKTASIEDMKTMNDYKLFLISMVFDVNFKYTFRILSEKQFVQKIYETLPKRDQIIDAYRGIKLFVENKFVS
jgi:hypothetical protein